jgi:hypothetical protein
MEALFEVLTPVLLRIQVFRDMILSLSVRILMFRRIVACSYAGNTVEDEGQEPHAQRHSITFQKT